MHLDCAVSISNQYIILHNKTLRLFETALHTQKLYEVKWIKRYTGLLF